MPSNAAASALTGAYVRERKASGMPGLQGSRAWVLGGPAPSDQCRVSATGTPGITSERAVDFDLD